MSDFLKNLKSIFVVEGEDTKVSSQGDLEQKAPPAAADQSASLEIDAADLGDGQVSEKFMEILLRAIEANNQKGFDYLEYKRALQNLQEMQMAEETKYKSAFAAAQTMGVTAQSLLQSADHYLGVLKGEDDKFAKALGNQKSRQIEGGHQKMTDLKRLIVEREDQVVALQKEIVEAKATLEGLRSEVEAATLKVEQTRLNFETTYSTLNQQIQADIENIKKYLQ